MSGNALSFRSRDSTGKNMLSLPAPFRFDILCSSSHTCRSTRCGGIWYGIRYCEKRQMPIGGVAFSVDLVVAFGLFDTNNPRVWLLYRAVTAHRKHPRGRATAMVCLVGCAAATMPSETHKAINDAPPWKMWQKIQGHHKNIRTAISVPDMCTWCATVHAAYDDTHHDTSQTRAKIGVGSCS